MTEELKPCPFCGKHPEMNSRSTSVWCVSSRNECPFGHLAMSPEEWNTRPIEDALRTELATLKEQVAEATKGPISLESVLIANSCQSEIDDLRAELARKDEEIKALEAIIEAEAAIQKIRQEKALAQMRFKPTFDENNALLRWSEKLNAARARLADIREGVAP